MARFKAPIRPKRGARTTVNLAGGQAYDRSPKVELAALVVNSMLRDTFYESGESQLERLRSLAGSIAKDGGLLWLAKAACYTRKVHGIRSISHALAGEIAQLRSDYPEQRGRWGRLFFQSVVWRLDDMSEIASYWLSKYGSWREKKTLPCAMKAGFRAVFESAKAGNLSKWNGKSTRSLTLRHLAHLCHPKGPEGSVIHRLRAGTLEAADTHEVAMSRAGEAEHAEEVKAQEWGRLLRSGKLRYAACLRNVRNVLEQAPESLEFLWEKLVSRADIIGSKVLPLEILKAHNETRGLSGPEARHARGALASALDIAVENMPELPGATCVVFDDSGSMHGGIGPPALIGSVFAATILKRSADADLIKFSYDASYATPDLSGNIVAIANQIMANTTRQGTNHSAPWHVMNRTYDRVFVLSDEQGWMGHRTPDAAVRDYEQRHEKRPFIYSWDLAGSATSQFPEHRVAVLAGQSCAVFDILRVLETDPQGLVHAIDEYRF